jgi:signal transduction histidine kinase/CheY-like chemotaxis protein
MATTTLTGEATAGEAPSDDALERAAPGDVHEISRARAVIWVNLACLAGWVVINVAASWTLHNARLLGVAGAGLAMAAAWTVALHQITSHRMAQGVATYTVSGLLLVLAMGLFVPELSILFTFATFIFLAFGLSYMSGRASLQVVALTIAIAAILLFTSLVLRWTSGLPADLLRWVNLTGMLMALSIDATMFIMLRRTLEARADRLVAAERDAARMQRRISEQERLESVGKLAGGVAHDFNNLLAIILNYCAFIAEAVEDRPEVRKDVDQVESAAQRAAALTRQLLIFGRREVVHGDVTDINQVVRDTESLLRSAVGGHIDLRTALGAERANVRVDTTRIEQILLNLSLNARDAMQDGGTLLIETSERNVSDDDQDAPAPKRGRYVSLRVSDSGTGFTEEARKHAFEPFFTTKPRGRGTGLGLATVYEIAQSAGGDVALYSEAGVGTSVRVYLPAVDEDATVGDATADLALPEGDGRTVLVVEDEPQLRHITARMLERHNYRVRAVENPHDAVRLLETDTPIALLLTDVVMPGMAGPQLAERASALRSDLRVLYMSGFPQDLWDQGEIDPDVQLIEKPFGVEELLRNVADALSKDLRK